MSYQNIDIGSIDFHHKNVECSTKAIATVDIMCKKIFKKQKITDKNEHVFKPKTILNTKNNELMFKTQYDNWGQGRRKLVKKTNLKYWKNHSFSSTN